jgi:four helix bundle protein
MKITNFEEILSWQKAKDLAVEIYQIKFKTNYGIDVGFKDQIQRAAISIMSNIAEGFERGTNKEFIRYLYIAKGSAGEVRSLLHIAKDLNYIDETLYCKLLEQVIEISKLISGFIKSLS